MPLRWCQVGSVGRKDLRPPLEKAEEPYVIYNYVSDMLGEGDRPVTRGGYLCSPFPKVDMSTNRRAINTTKRLYKWLFTNAMDLAHTEGNSMSESIFKRELQEKHPPPASIEGANEYLFGEWS